MVTFDSLTARKDKIAVLGLGFLRHRQYTLAPGAASVDSLDPGLYGAVGGEIWSQKPPSYLEAYLPPGRQSGPYGISHGNVSLGYRIDDDSFFYQLSL